MKKVLLSLSMVFFGLAIPVVCMQKPSREIRERVRQSQQSTSYPSKIKSRAPQHDGVMDVNKRLAGDKTMLHNAVIRGDRQKAQQYLSLGADKTLKDNTGRTALDYARESQDEDMIALFFIDNNQ